ncbi:MAG: hypothetical protein K6F94_03575 [Bacteroidaceae bacterium]|nr:hypothetical protein [Bacteroidaceae bacterium]
MKKYYFLATALVALASCTSDEFVGEGPSLSDNVTDDAIVFSSSTNGITRADIYGNAAATLLGNNFYVTGTKGTEAAKSPTPTLVFDNYLVHYTANTADQTESNTANWEYVGVTPGSAPTANYVKLAETAQAQTIKYWDYSAAQYDFLAFSTGTFKAVKGASTAADNIGVTKMLYGTGLASSAVAYTFSIPSVNALKSTYISDITEVAPANYGKEVQLKFKNLGSKVRIALYETVPGYSVKDVKFYQADALDLSGSSTTTAALISASSLPTSGTINVFFPHVGNDNASAEDYNKAATTVTAGSSTVTYQTYGTLHNFVGKESYEAASTVYLGRTLPTATYAGSAAANYYETVFPVSSSSALTLRVDYTLVSTDGSGETINVKGARAVVPATYTKWLPNYAYTYVFKITDNTNGWTGTASQPAGLFPITFDAVVAEATDVNAEQTTITTVAAPTITTYQQGHDKTKNEYSKATGKDIYVQVMNNSTSPATLVNTLEATNSLVYELSADATEAKVMDALTMRTTAVSADNVTGRNGLVLTKKSVIDNAVESIVNGVDNNPISVTKKTAGKISISDLTADKSYAYVYIPTASNAEVNQFEPVVLANDAAIAGTEGYYSIAKTTVAGGSELAAAEAPNAAYIYFSVTENGTGVKTYSYISPLGKATIPAGCIKVAKTSLTAIESATTASDANFYFAKYITNNGSYAVKVIKVVA